MTHTLPKEAEVSAPRPHTYDRRSLTYANSFDRPLQSLIIQTVEWLTAKPKVLERVSQFERQGEVIGQAFWHRALDTMGIERRTPPEELARIPKEGPVVLVANHPHGLVDGMILADLIGRIRPDYRILTRALLAGIDETATSYMIPVPFPNEPDAQRKMIQMRQSAMDHLSRGGLVALFPSGVVAASESAFGPVIEAPWNVFTAKMIRVSGARVVPLFFPGRNSRAYMVANRLSATLRQSLLLYEVIRSLDKPHRAVIGPAFDAEEIAARIGKPRDFMAWLRSETLALGARV